MESIDRAYLLATKQVAELLVDKFSLDTEMVESGNAVECAILSINLLIKNTEDINRIAMYTEVRKRLFKLR